MTQVDENCDGFKKFFELVQAAKRKQNDNADAVLDNISEELPLEESKLNSKGSGFITSNRASNFESNEDLASVSIQSIVSDRAKQKMEENEMRVIDDCNMLGITLPDINDFTMPRFSCPVNKINYSALISKAYYFYWRENKSKKARIDKKKSGSVNSSALEYNHGGLNSQKTMVIGSTHTELV